LHSIAGNVLTLSSIAEQISSRRRAMGLTQTALSKNARFSRATLDVLENGKLGELGYGLCQE
jgi:DNA-binding XRE family transcriptional regulator